MGLRIISGSVLRQQLLLIQFYYDNGSQLNLPRDDSYAMEQTIQINTPKYDLFMTGSRVGPLKWKQAISLNVCFMSDINGPDERKQIKLLKNDIPIL